MSLKQKTVKGLFWSGSSQAGKLISQFIITAILARLLSPKDFGLVGMATVFTGFAAIFSEMGISSALIQKQDTHDRHYYSAFWLNVFVGVLLTVVFILIAPMIAGFYRRPELTTILIALSINYSISSFAIIQQAILTKKMDFKSLSTRDISATILSGIVGIYFAYKGFGVWSLVYQSISFTIINTLLLWFLSKWRPKFAFAKSDIRDIIGYSSDLTGFNVVNYVARNVDYLLVGKFLGAEALGLYTLAYKLMLVPLQNISWVISKVIFPAFSKIQHDLEKLRNAYLKMTKAISLVTFPMMFGLFAAAPEFIRVIYGPKWEQVILLIQILCFCGLVQSVSSIVGNIRLSTGHTRLHLKIGIFNALFAVIAITGGLYWGLLGVVICYTVFSIIWAYYTNYVTLPLIKLKMSAYFESMKAPLISSIVMVLALMVIKRLVRYDMTVMLFVLVISGMSIYVSSLIALKQIIVKNKTIEIPDLI